MSYTADFRNVLGKDEAVVSKPTTELLLDKFTFILFVFLSEF